mmetsp:Transcript_33531/g.87199  ORF Transcript_33531/g.87199 Transcript_33531/m.87199 type:complete len:218 (+) Transcript_33531:45-698(+)
MAYMKAFVLRNTFLELADESKIVKPRSCSEPPRSRSYEDVQEIHDVHAQTPVESVPVNLTSMTTECPEAVSEVPWAEVRAGTHVPVQSTADNTVTTVTLHNISHRVLVADIRNALDQAGYAGSYDYVFTPLSKKAKANAGVAYVNFVTAEIASHCIAHGRDTLNLAKAGTKLRCGPARVQGKAANEAEQLEALRKQASVNKGSQRPRRGRFSQGSRW